MRRHIGSPQDQKRVPTAACSNPTSVPPTRPPCGWPISLPPTAALLHFLVFVHFMLTQKPPHVLLRCLQSSSTLPDTEATSPGEEPFSTKRSWALAVHSSTRQAQGQGQCPRRTPFFPLWREPHPAGRGCPCNAMAPTLICMLRSRHRPLAHPKAPRAAASMPIPPMEPTSPRSLCPTSISKHETLAQGTN